MAALPGPQQPGPNTQKKARFLAGPMGMKPVTDVPGIGPVIGQTLTENGFVTASSIFGVFLQMEPYEARFKQWFYKITGSHAAQPVYNALQEYKNNYLD